MGLEKFAAAASSAGADGVLVVDLTPEEVAKDAGAPLLAGTSIKAELDLEWSDPAQKASAIGTLVEQLDRLERWIARVFGEEASEPPLAEPLATLRHDWPLYSCDSRESSCDRVATNPDTPKCK